MVLLTLLSIVQALALELLWTHIRESTHLSDMSLSTLVSWAQIATTFMGIVLIWVVYASIAMRFRWVPSTSDSIYPFIIGLLEFAQIEALAPEYLGWWFALLAMIFGLMTVVTHLKMRRARLDGENDEFFTDFKPATIRDFLPATVIVIGFVIAGLYFGTSGNRGIVALVAVSVSLALLIRQLFVAAGFWEMSVSGRK
jgi:hypothetical protein